MEYCLQEAEGAEVHWKAEVSACWLAFGVLMNGRQCHLDHRADRSFDFALVMSGGGRYAPCEWMHERLMLVQSARFGEPPLQE